MTVCVCVCFLEMLFTVVHDFNLSRDKDDGSTLTTLHLSTRRAGTLAQRLETAEADTRLRSPTGDPDWTQVSQRLSQRDANLAGLEAEAGDCHTCQPIDQ